ncbi:RNA polymerase [Globomyces pollinis-pini]|nr:RNA polymerase [Globomyces pollinis-pini]
MILENQENRDISRLWRVYRTVHEMVLDRKYRVSKTELDISLDEFRSLYSHGGSIDRQRLSFLVENESSSEDRLLVFFSDEESLGVKHIKKICERMVSQQVFKGILVYQKGLTPSAKKTVVQDMAPKYMLELFCEDELLVNITKHILVPPHEVLTADEKKTLLQRYRLKDTQLPRIQSSDPIARYYGLKRGQVVKITRPSETAGQYVTYRFCF